MLLQGFLVYRGKRRLTDAVLLKPVLVDKLVARDHIAGLGLPPGDPPGGAGLAGCGVVQHLENTLALVGDEASINLDAECIILAVFRHQGGLAGDLEEGKLVFHSELSAV